MPARLKKVPLTIFQRFFRTETLGGLALLGFGLAALAIANSPLAAVYNHLWEIPLTLGIAPHELSLLRRGSWYASDRPPLRGWDRRARAAPRVECPCP